MAPRTARATVAIWAAGPSACSQSGRPSRRMPGSSPSAVNSAADSSPWSAGPIFRGAPTGGLARLRGVFGSGRDLRRSAGALAMNSGRPRLHLLQDGVEIFVGEMFDADEPFVRVLHRMDQF